MINGSKLSDVRDSELAGNDHASHYLESLAGHIELKRVLRLDLSDPELAMRVISEIQSKVNSERAKAKAITSLDTHPQKPQKTFH